MSEGSDGAIVLSVKMQNKNGLHARPAHLFVQTANRFSSELFVGRKGQDRVNGKSIMGIMMLAAEQGVELELEARGGDAKEQLDALKELIDARFGED